MLYFIFIFFLYFVTYTRCIRMKNMALFLFISMFFSLSLRFSSISSSFCPLFFSFCSLSLLYLHMPWLLLHHRVFNFIFLIVRNRERRGGEQMCDNIYIHIGYTVYRTKEPEWVLTARFVQVSDQI